MIIGCADTFLNNVNSDPILRPYLIEYPFPSERLSLAFWIRDKDLQPITTPEVLYSVQLYKNEIEYNTLKKKSPYERDAEKVLMHSETYEEAKRILKDA